LAQLTEVRGPNGNDRYTGKLGSVNIEFARIPEQPAWKTGGIESYNSNRYWWVTTDRDEDRKKIFIVKNKPESGRELDLSGNNLVATHNSDDIRT
jgi:hypothetical protein